MMHSKWADACTQILAFDQVRSPTCDLRGEPFCRHVVRLFMQMSAMATLRLGGRDMVPGQQIDLSWLVPPPPRKATRMNTISAKLSEYSFGKRKKSASQPPSPNAPPANRRASKVGIEQEKIDAAHVTVPSLPSRQMSRIVKPSPPSRTNSRGYDSTRELGVADGVTLQTSLKPEEMEYLKASSACPVLCTSCRLIRAITTRQEAGGMHAPAPQVSRIFQEVSTGILAYNNAVKSKEVPVPFAFVQLQHAALLLFTVITPMGIASLMNPSIWAPALVSSVVVGCYVALWVVANELEDPFGSDPNDLPMIAYHEDFCLSLVTLLRLPWMTIDHWTVPKGKWQAPPEAPAAAPQPEEGSFRRTVKPVSRSGSFANVFRRAPSRELVAEDGTYILPDTFRRAVILPLSADSGGQSASAGASAQDDDDLQSKPPPPPSRSSTSELPGTSSASDGPSRLSGIGERSERPSREVSFGGSVE